MNTTQNLLELVEEYRVRVKAMQKPLGESVNSDNLGQEALRTIPEAVQ